MQTKNKLGPKFYYKIKLKNPKKAEHFWAKVDNLVGPNLSENGPH
jgi:hypothetical protein